MAHPEMLSRLTASACNMTPGIGGKRELETVEVAGLLCSINPVAIPWTYFRYTGDHSSKKKLKEQAVRQSLKVFRSQNWRHHRYERLPTALGWMALDEILDRKPCTGCGGSRYEPTGEWCESCAGSGHSRDPLTDKERAKRAGMAYTTWVSTWRARYIMVRQQVGQWVAEMDSMVWEGLKHQ